ncbi:MAG: hypothetical protein BWX71_01693 [Deltaproteobacteria bacterium ADurb.Bin072]|nr:MAG: hypothetical protein BWX71_01693 [Deltaproteobacteria bacterium ADurb.Bin072]
MGGRKPADARHVAHRTGRRRVITGLPCIGRALPVPGVPLGLIALAMVRFLPDLDLGMVGADVAGTARLRHAGLHEAEAVPGVAGPAVALGPVRVDPADAFLGVVRAARATLHEGHLAAVALDAAGDLGRVRSLALPLDGHGPELHHRVVSCRVIADAELACLGGMAAGAVLRARQGRYEQIGPLESGALKGIGFPPVRAVAVAAGDARPAVHAVFPVEHDRRRCILVALDALPVQGRHAPVHLDDLRGHGPYPFLGLHSKDERGPGQHEDKNHCEDPLLVHGFSPSIEMTSDMAALSRWGSNRTG